MGRDLLMKRAKMDKRKTEKEMKELRDRGISLSFKEAEEVPPDEPTQEPEERTLSEDSVKFGNGKKSLLTRKTKEPEIAHRAFLLWAMQTRHKREKSCTARAVNRSHVSISKYHKKWEWDERALHLSAEVEAQGLYRELYLEMYGMGEMQAVQKNILTPVSVSKKPREMMETVEKIVEKTEGAKNTFEKEIKRKHVMLIDAALGYLAQGIKDGDIRRSLRDIPNLIALRNELIGEGGSGQGRHVVVESLRVQEAKAMGENVIEAMHQDAVELAAILGTLSSQGKASSYIKKHQQQEE
jgi:hypothetical protein